MPGIPYTKSPELIPKVLDHVQNSPIPDKATAAYLESKGLTSSDDRNMISLLKGIKFISSTGKPTERWKAYRAKSTARRELAKDIRTGYPEIFKTHPNAPLISDEAIAKVINRTTNYADPDVFSAVATFRNLCDRADFTKAPAAKRPAAPPKSKPAAPVNIPAATTPAPKATVKPNTSIDLAKSELMSQAYKCVEHELFLPAHVMAWAAFMEFLFEKLEADKLFALRRVRKGWKGDTILEMAERIQERLFVETLEELGFCTKNQQERFVSLLDRRNDCAHPTSRHRPDLKETEGYISELINRAKPLAERSL